MSLEIRQVSVYDDDAPFSGKGTCVLLDLNEMSATLFYPFTLDEFTLPRRDVWSKGELKVRGYDTATAASDLFWPENFTGLKFSIEKFCACLLNKAKERYALKRQVPVRTCARIYSELKGVSVKEAELAFQRVGTGTAPTQPSFTISPRTPDDTGRRGVVISVMKDLKRASMTEIIEACRPKLKTTMKLERVVTYFVNDFVHNRIAAVQGEHIMPATKKKLTERKPKAVKAAKKTAAVKKAKAPISTGVANRTYELMAAGQDPEKFRGQRVFIVKAMLAGAKTLDQIMKKCEAAGLKPREGGKMGVDLEWMVKDHLRMMVNAKQAKIVAAAA